VGKRRREKTNATKIPDDVVKAPRAAEKVDAVRRRDVYSERGRLGNAGPAVRMERPTPAEPSAENLLETWTGCGRPRWTAERKMDGADAAGQRLLCFGARGSRKCRRGGNYPAMNKKMNDAGIPHIVGAAAAA